MLDLLEIPYQGSGVLGRALAMNKELSKILYQQAGLKVAGPWSFPGAGRQSPANGRELGLPVVIKPVNEGSSIGITQARSMAELEEASPPPFLRPPGAGGGVRPGGGGHRRGPREPGPVLSPCGDHPLRPICLFRLRGQVKPGASGKCARPGWTGPPRRAQESARTAHRALHCRGYSRTDMIIQDGEIYVLETNTIPGMTATSLFPQAARAAGLEFPQLLDRLITLALEKSKQ